MANYEVLAPGGHEHLIGKIKETTAETAQEVATEVALLRGKLAATTESILGAPTSGTWVTRESTGFGAVTVESVQGAAVGWNQLAQVIDATRTSNGVTFVSSSDGKVVANGEASGNAYANTIDVSGIASGHVYLFKSIPAGGSTNTYRAYLQGDPLAGVANRYDYGSGVIVTAVASGTASIVPLYVYSGYTANNLVSVPQLFDLTAMFGAGNEPSTVAEFEAMFPEAYYPYSAPTLKPVQIAGIVSTNAQGDELDSVEWETQTLRAAGSVADMLYSDHVDVRVGAVDLGTLDWSYTSANDYFYATLADMAVVPSANVMPDFECAAYTVVTATTNDGWASKPDKSIGTRHTTKYVCVKDTDYTDGAAFKAAMSGVMLYYALATPTTTSISPALPMSYKVEQGGTESIIVPEGEVSAAPLITLAEGESAAELVMAALAAIAAPDGPTATGNHAVGTYLTMGGKLYKVTTAIAAGETIAAGTNVTQTTVMDELIARTA